MSLSSPLRAGLTVGLAATSLLLAPRAARACSPPPPEVLSVTPGDGQSYPANAAIYLEGYGLSLEGATVTVDGAPAALVPVTLAEGLAPANGLFGQTLTARVEPAPAAGQTVVLRGTFCGDFPSGEAPCGERVITYTATAPDAAAPPRPPEARYDVHDHTDFLPAGPGSCFVPSELTYWVSLTPPLPAAGEAPVAYVVEGFRDAALSSRVFVHSALATPELPAFGQRLLASALGTTSPADLCVRVRAVDLAGNEAGEAAVTCDPCHLKTDPSGGQMGAGPPPQPTWTPADIFPGGSCDASGGAGGSAGNGGGGGGAGGASGAGGSGGAGGGGSGAGGSGGAGPTFPGGGDDDSSGSCTVSVPAGGRRAALWGWCVGAAAALALGVRRWARSGR
jgi:hypothetical protein